MLRLISTFTVWCRGFVYEKKLPSDSPFLVWWSFWVLTCPLSFLPLRYSWLFAQQREGQWAVAVANDTGGREVWPHRETEETEIWCKCFALRRSCTSGSWNEQPKDKPGEELTYFQKTTVDLCGEKLGKVQEYEDFDIWEQENDTNLIFFSPSWQEIKYTSHNVLLQLQGLGSQNNEISVESWCFLEIELIKMMGPRWTTWGETIMRLQTDRITSPTSPEKSQREDETVCTVLF